MGLYLDPVIQMAGSIFLGSYCDFSQGKIYGLGKDQKDSEGQSENGRRGDVENIQDFTLGMGNLAARQMKDHIAVGSVISDHRSRYGENVLIKKAIIIPNGVGAAS